MSRLARKHPPRRFEDVLGQDQSVQWLRGQILAGTGMSVILGGPHGTGKTSSGRVYAKAHLCQSPTPSGSPCLQCAACEAFDQAKSGFNHTEVNCAELRLDGVQA